MHKLEAMSAFAAALIACGWMGLVIGVFTALGPRLQQGKKR